MDNVKFAAAMTGMICAVIAVVVAISGLIVWTLSFNPWLLIVIIPLGVFIGAYLYIRFAD